MYYVKPGFSDKYGKNPLYHAIKVDGKADVIRMLIANKCDVNNRDLSEKRMPLAVSRSRERGCYVFT